LIFDIKTIAGVKLFNQFIKVFLSEIYRM